MLRKDLGLEERELAELLDVAPETVRPLGERVASRSIGWPSTSPQQIWLDRRDGSTAVLDHLKALGDQ